MQPLTDATRRVLAPINYIGRERLRIDLAGDDRHLQLTPVNSEGVRDRLNMRAVNILVSRIPERKQLEDGTWSVAATDTSIAIIDHAWPKDKLSFGDADAATVFNWHKTRMLQHAVNVENYAQYKASHAVPSHKLLFSADPKLHLSPYQQVGLVNSSNTDGFGLFMEQGTGKTPVAVARICNDARLYGGANGPYYALVVCPSNVQMNWQKEVKQFATEPGKVTVLRGTQLDRVDQLTRAIKCDSGEKFSVVVCSYDVLINSWDALQLVEWDLSILDESHYIKSNKTKRYKYAMKLRDRSARRMALTGTPITNTALDLYTQLEFLGEGYSGFLTWKGFKNFYGNYVRGEDGFEKLVSLQNLPFMQERLTRMSFIIRKAEALPDLPEKQYDIEEVEMTPRQAKLYDELSRQMAVEIESMLDSSKSETMVVQNILTKLLRLAQITSGFITYDPILNEDGSELRGSQIEMLDPSPKLDRCVELMAELKERPNSKALIWACWRPDLDNIVARLRNEGHKVVQYDGKTSHADRVEAERAFNADPETQIFVGNPQAGGTGLNLLGYPPGHGDEYTTNCDWIVYYSQNWSPTARSQSEDRPNRRGTRVPTRITDLCVPNTIDEEIRERVLNKITSALQVADIRHILSAVLQRDN